MDKPITHARRTACLLSAAGAVAAVLQMSPPGVRVASGEPCPDVEVIFARGTSEPPGVGGFGRAFVDILQSQIGPRSLSVYAVDYPASTDFPTAADGVIDARNRITSTVANCPETKMVLGGFSQGAAVIGYVTADAIPAGLAPPPGISGPMAPDVADHVASVVLFGKPSAELLSDYHAPPIVIGARYAPKLLDLCAPGDPICAPDGVSGIAHAMYAVNGMVGQGAGFAAQRLNAELPKVPGGQ